MIKATSWEIHANKSTALIDISLSSDFPPQESCQHYIVSGPRRLETIRTLMLRLAWLSTDTPWYTSCYQGGPIVVSRAKRT
ncbi:hypothetical protein RRG08_021575 [Elysia crispata]|uniref:Uncharacterized protein n=1 Tax=Elysia crispata TaxID=231223 RepID=A0AAE0XDW9_9GAST|nr:hypothetical protein RRG08_021575 [Elysia crispata]